MAVKRARVGKKRHAWVKWVVALCVLVFLGVVFAASVGIGNWMLSRAQQYSADQEQQTVTVPPEQIVPVKVSPITAHAYALGGRYNSYLNAGITQLCAPLRAEDGALLFDSRTCLQAGWEENGDVDLATNAWELHQNGMYLCAYMPITGFAMEDAMLRELTLSYEATLIAEAAESGVDEIILTDLPVSTANIEKIVHYISRIKGLSGNCAIGVMITPEVLQLGRQDVYLAAQLLSVCDFLVLDLRNLPLSGVQTGVEVAPGENQAMSVSYVLEHMQYDLVRYFPRLALTKEQTDALDYLMTKGYHNWVIVE